jgi:hypothetical protein
LLASNCTAPQCWIDCSTGFAQETELRNAVEAANDCNPNPNFSRIIYFKGTGTCTVNLANNNPAAEATCPGIGQFFDSAICLRGHDIWVGGSNATTFVYAGSSGACDPDLGNSTGPPAFVLRGHDNAVFWFDTQFFHEGIDVREGTGHIVEDVSSDYFCDEAITVKSGSTTFPTLVNLITLRGHTQSSSLRCKNGKCGTDKGIQVLSGVSTISNSTFINVRAPVEVLGGTHTIGAPPPSPNEPNIIVRGLAPNAACNPPFHCGDAANNPDKYCEGLEFSGGTATVEGVSIADCKFGMSIDRKENSLQSVTVTANDNTITDGYKSAFRVIDRGTDGGTATLTGMRNRIRRAGFSNEGEGCRAAVVIYNNEIANNRIDVDLSGDNCFCQDTLKDIRNLRFVGEPESPTSCTLGALYTESATDNCWDANDGPDVDIEGPILTLPRDIGGCQCSSF